MCVEVVIKDVNVARRISFKRRVVTASRFLHVCTLKNESRASPVTEILEVARVSKNIRQTSWKVRPSAKKCEICFVCNVCVTRKNHECFEPCCVNCNKNMEINHLCYMQPLKNELPSAGKVLFVFYDFETTQDRKISETAKLHVPIPVCLQQFCTACEMQDDYEQDYARCGKRRHSFFEEPRRRFAFVLMQTAPLV